MRAVDIELYVGDVQIRGIASDKLSFGQVYGSEGSGFTYATFETPYEAVRGIPLIGSDIAIRRYLNTILFSGQIRELERTIKDGTEIASIKASGDLSIFGDDEFLRAFCDKRYSKWAVPSEVPSSYFRPDIYTTGSDSEGLYIHCNSNQSFVAGQYTAMQYEVYSGEQFERIRLELSLSLGRGILFDADVSALDPATGEVTYTNDAGEGFIESGMTLHNLTQSRSVGISSIDTGTNIITVDTPAELSGWTTSDEISVPGPAFWATISSISTDTITYTDETGEGNISTGLWITNATKKSMATVSSNDTGADTITVDDEDDVATWESGDLISINASLFYATVSSVSPDGDSTGTVSYSGAYGERVVSSAIGWNLYNETQDESAYVDAWNTGSDEVGVDDYDDISGWSASDIIRIYTPFNLQIIDDTGVNVIWSGVPGVPYNRRIIDVVKPASSITTVLAVMQNWLSGTANESSFVRLSNIRLYTTDKQILTAGTLAEEAVSVLSDPGHGFDASVTDIYDMRIFTGTISSIASQVITYSAATNESDLAEDQYLYNEDQDETVVIESVNTGSNEITIHSDYDISGWSGAETIYTYNHLEQMFFEFRSVGEAMEWAASFGDGLGNRVAWGLRLNRKRQMFLEIQDTEDVQYVIRPDLGAEIKTSWNLNDSLQQIRGSYRDEDGVLALTSWFSDPDAYFGNDRFRRRSVDISSVNESDLAGDLSQQALLDQKYAQESGAYTVPEGAVFTSTGAPVPLGMLKAKGQMIAVESADQMRQGRAASDGRNRVAVFQLVGVETDWDDGTTTLMPASPIQNFARMIAAIERSKRS